MDIKHKKNTAYYLAFPMIDSATPADFKSGETVTDTAYYKDGAGAWTSLSITDTVSEIGSTGMYEIDLTASELNHDKVLIKMSSSSAADTAFLFTLTAQDVDDLNITASGNIGMDWANVENPGSTVDLSDTAINLCDTTTTNTDMRGTDNAALASVLGALADAAAAGDPTSADTLMQYVKQLINILVGTTGVTTFPAEAGPGNNVSLAEVIRAIHADVTGLDGDAMRGTDSAYTGTPPTAAAIVNEWESQSQTDPTGFHVNVKEVNDTAQTANDNGADINTLLTRIVGTLAAGTHVAQSADNDTKLSTLLTRIVGTLAAGTHTAQSADNDTKLTTLLARVVGTLAAGTHNPPLSAAETQSECEDAIDGKFNLSAGIAESNVKQINDESTEASTLQKVLEGTVTGAAAAGTLSTTQMTTNLTEVTNDHYNGRILTFTTGVLVGQSTDITDYDGASKMLTFTALTEAMSASDEFVIT